MAFYLLEFARKRLQSYGFSLVDLDCYFYVGEISGRIRDIKVPEYCHVMEPCNPRQFLMKPFLFQDFDLIKRLLRYYSPPECIINDDFYSYADHVLKCVR